MAAKKSPFTWVVRHGFLRTVLKYAARRGEVIARLNVEPKARENPYPIYDWVRDHGPIWKGRLSTVTSSHAGVSSVLRSEVFRVGLDIPGLPAPVRWALVRGDSKIIGPIDPPSLLAVNPPDHTRYRRLVGRVFTPRAIGALEPRVQQIADELLDDMVRHGANDLVTEYAALLPVTVISEILGVPTTMRGDFLRWGHAGAPSLDVGLSYREWLRMERGVYDFNIWMYRHIDRLRAEPGDDLLSKLIQVEDESGRLTDKELLATAGLLLAAGFETTVNLLGSGARALMDHPDQLEVLRADPNLWPNAVDELLRYESPVQNTGRWAAEDTEVCGVPVASGTFISVLIGAANRDPEVFENPARFDVTRANARDHLALSAGVHYCIGASLARAEGRIGLQTLFDRFPDLALAGEPVRRPTRNLRGYDSLPVRLGRSTQPA